MSADPTPADVYEAAPDLVETALIPIRDAAIKLINWQITPDDFEDAVKEAVSRAVAAAGRAAATPDGGTWQWGVRSQRGGETIVAWYRDERAARYFHSLGEGDPSHALIRRWTGPVEPVPAPDATETGR